MSTSTSNFSSPSIKNSKKIGVGFRASGWFLVDVWEPLVQKLSDRSVSQILHESIVAICIPFTLDESGDFPKVIIYHSSHCSGEDALVFLGIKENEKEESPRKMTFESLAALSRRLLNRSKKFKTLTARVDQDLWKILIERSSLNKTEILKAAVTLRALLERTDDEGNPPRAMIVSTDNEGKQQETPLREYIGIA